MTIGRYGVLAPEEARKIAKRRLGTVADGKDPVAVKKAADALDSIIFNGLDKTMSIFNS